MIKAGTLKKFLADIPDEAKINAYEGEDDGLSVALPDGSYKWIRARSTNEEDEQPDFIMLEREEENLMNVMLKIYLVGFLKFLKRIATTILFTLEWVTLPFIYFLGRKR
jgi:hypothetical protein